MSRLLSRVSAAEVRLVRGGHVADLRPARGCPGPLGLVHPRGLVLGLEAGISTRYTRRNAMGGSADHYTPFDPHIRAKHFENPFEC